MEVKLKYFGMIAEEIGKEQETLSDENIIAISEWENRLKEIYPALKNKTFRLALNQELKDSKSLVQDGDELAILPAFAGG